MRDAVNDYRIYIIFRADLPEMTRAKGEVQAAHAASSLVYQLAQHPAGMDVLHDYMSYDDLKAAETGLVHKGQIKINMEVDDLPALQKICERAINRNVDFVMIQDAGHTVFAGPTITCVAIGPCSKTNGNAITRGARMRV